MVDTSDKEINKKTSSTNMFILYVLWLIKTLVIFTIVSEEVFAYEILTINYFQDIHNITDMFVCGISIFYYNPIIVILLTIALWLILVGVLGIVT